MLRWLPALLVLGCACTDGPTPKVEQGDTRYAGRSAHRGHTTTEIAERNLRRLREGRLLHQLLTFRSWFPDGLEKERFTEHLLVRFEKVCGGLIISRLLDKYFPPRGMRAELSFDCRGDDEARSATRTLRQRLRRRIASDTTAAAARPAVPPGHTRRSAEVGTHDRCDPRGRTRLRRSTSGALHQRSLGSFAPRGGGECDLPALMSAER